MHQQDLKLHIVMITNVVVPDKLGGLERYVRELSAELVRQGHSVTVISKRTSNHQPNEEKFPDGVKVRRYNMPSKRDPFFALKYPFTVNMGVKRALRGALLEGNSEHTIIHGHFPLPMIYPLINRMPYIYTCHNPVHKEILDERQGSYRLPGILQSLIIGTFKAMEKRVIRSAEKVVTLSQFVCDEVVELTHNSAASITRIPGGLDTSWFSPGSTLDTRESLPGPLLFTARRLVSRTGIGELVRAMPLILQQIPGARLTIAGDGPLKESLQRTIEELGLTDKVELLGGLGDADLRSWYRRADIAVTPTRKLEGFGLSTVEAMSCGAVPLVTPIAANPEIVSNLSPLLVAPSADAEGLAEGVVQLWRAPAYAHIKASVRSEVHPQFSWPQVSRQYLDLYQEAVQAAFIAKPHNKAVAADQA